MRKFCIWGLGAFLLGLLLWTNPLEVHAQDYAWAEDSVGNKSWYKGEDSYSGNKMDNAPTSFGAEDVINIWATPDEGCETFLKNLTGNVGYINVYADSSITIGQENQELNLGSINTLQSEGKAITVWANVESVQVYKGSITVNGNVNLLVLGDPYNLNDIVPTAKTVTVNGNVGTVHWAKESSESIASNCFKGTATVTGTVSNGQIMQFFYDSVLNKSVNKVTANIASCEAGVFKIENGTLDRNVSTTPVEVSVGEYYYEYQCYASADGVNNQWKKMFYDKSTGDLATDENCNQSDIPEEGARITMYGSNSPVVFEGNVGKLYMRGGDITINGNITGNAEGGSDAAVVLDPYLNGKCNVTISGNVPSFQVSYRYNPACNATIGGTIEDGYYYPRLNGFIASPKYFSGSNVTLVENGNWNPNILLRMQPAENSLAYEEIKEEAVKSAVGDANIGQEVSVEDQTLVKRVSASVEQTSSETVTNLGQQEDFQTKMDAYIETISSNTETDMQATPVCGVDITINSFYENKDTGEISTDPSHGIENITDLAEGQQLEFNVKVPGDVYDATASYAVVREHADTLEVLPTTQQGDKLSFSSDKFSTFVIVELKEEGTGQPQQPSNPTEPAQPVQPQQPSQPQQSSGSSQQTSVKTQNSGNSQSTAKTEVKEPVNYLIKRGDTLSKIAARHGLRLSELLLLNPQIKNPNRIYPGQVIIVDYASTNKAGSQESVAGEGASYTVVKGDSLYKIARRYKISLNRLYSLNPEIARQKYIFPGQNIRVR